MRLAGLSRFLGRWSGGRADHLPRPGLRLIIHAGLHKTGTTAVQNTLAAGADRLRPRGVLYPHAGRSRPDYSRGHHNLAWELAGDRRFRATLGTVDDVAAEIGAFDGDAILSSEDFETVLGAPGRLRRLVRHPRLRGRNVVILVYLREQVGYAESLFLELLDHRSTIGARAFCDRILADGRLRFADWIFHFDYERLHRRLARARLGSLVMRPYSGMLGGSSIRDVLDLLGVAEQGGFDDGDDRHNDRDTLAQSLARFCRLRLSRDGDEVEARLERWLHPQLLERRAQLATARRCALRARFAPGNERVARACGFPHSALAIPVGVAPDTLDLEQLFSARNADLAAAWLDGRLTGARALECRAAT